MVPRKYAWTAVVLLSSACLAAGIWALPRFAGHLSYAAVAAQSEVAREQLRTVTDLSTAFSRVAEAIRPSVVNISTVKKVNVPLQRRDNGRPEPFFRDSPFHDFFGDRFFERFFGGRTPENFEQRGLGTGVIVSADGYILTNNHVIAGANEVLVKLVDGRELAAEVVGTDDKTDIAVLKVDASGLKAAALGDSDSIVVGEWVVAVGNPFGLESTVTSGIVSAKGRANVGVAEFEDFIQTDAAINPGNSGGPLLNLRGEVIGINTAISTRTGGYMGIGFAIPSNMARSVMDKIMTDGRVVRGWLGVMIQDLSQDLAGSFGHKGTDGVLVGDVTKGGPAEAAGIRQGDIITRFDGRRTENTNRLRNIVAATAPGTKVEVEIYRDGERKTLTVEIAEREVNLRLVNDREVEVDLGMTVKNLTPDVARQIEADEGTEGVVVTDVKQGGMAFRAGLRAGDVIVAVGGKSVSSIGEFRDLLARKDLKEGLRMQVLRDGFRRFVFLKRN